MLLIPIGHDQSVYGRQWTTLGLIALNALLFLLVALFLAWPASRRYDEARDNFWRVALEFPEARMSPSVVRDQPHPIYFALVARVSDEGGITEADMALEDAARGLIHAYEAQPSVRFGYVPERPSILGLFTCMFLHGGLMHLLGNMLFLWLAGTVIECFWDRKPFLILYFVAGVGATLVHHLANPDSSVPLIGASGAIAGLMGAFVVGYPKTRIRFLFIFFYRFMTFHARAWIVIPLWGGLQLLWAVTDAHDGVAYWAHVGGFAIGMIAALIMKKLGWMIEDAGEHAPSPAPSTSTSPRPE